MADQSALPVGTDLEALARTALPMLDAGAAQADDDDRFVGANLQWLADMGFLEAGVPVALGGGGAGIGALADALRVLAQACGSTALALSMHSHQVAVPAWRYMHRGASAVEPLLRRVATERIMVLSSGGSDWIGGSGTARRVEGGYRITARKRFTSAAPMGAILMTGAVLEEDGRRTVLHFGAPMNAEGVRIEDTWHTIGMRGTGSHDVVFDDLFIPETAIAFQRPAGEWHPMFQIIATMAFPLIYAVYLGVAESARDIAVDLARKRPTGPHVLTLAGRMDTALRAAQLGHRLMVETAEKNDPGEASINEVMIGRSLVAEHAIRTVELAMELAGGAGFYRELGLERRFRDVQGARYHPLQPGPQAEYAGAMALGLPVANVW